MRLLVLNLQLLPPGCSTTGNNHKDARLQYFCTHILPQYDIVCLSEVWKVHTGVSLPGAAWNRREQLVCSAQRCGFGYKVVSSPPPLCCGKFVDAGLLILSRFPIEHSIHINFQHLGCGVERFVANGAQYAKICIGTRALHLVNTHLQSDQVTRVRERDSGTDARQAQIKEVWDLVQQAAVPPEELLLLVGDLNVDAHDAHKGPGTGHAPGSALNGTPSPWPERQEYLDMIALFHAQDLLAEDGRHPVTLGDVKVEADGTTLPAECVLTCADDRLSNQSVDHVWQLYHESTGSDALAVVDTQIRELRVEGVAFTQLSDHYGIEVRLTHAHSAAATVPNSS